MRHDARRKHARLESNSANIDDGFGGVSANADGPGVRDTARGSRLAAVQRVHERCANSRCAKRERERPVKNPLDAGCRIGDDTTERDRPAVRGTR